MKFTFKTEHPTGRYASFFSDNHYIKMKRKQCGTIDDKPPYKIRLQVVKPDILEDGNANCEWKWITLKKESETLEEAKTFLNDNAEAILKKWKLHLMDE